MSMTERQRFWNVTKCRLIIRLGSSWVVEAGVIQGERKRRQLTSVALHTAYLDSSDVYTNNAATVVYVGHLIEYV